MATAPKVSRQVADLAENATVETVEAKHRGRTAEPFAHTVEPFVLTLSFHDEITEESAGAVISAALEAVNSAVSDGSYQSRRVTRGEPSFYRQTLKIAPEGFEWSEQREKVERGMRIDAETNKALEGLSKRTGKPKAELLKELIARLSE